MVKKKWINGVFVEGSLCSHLSWNERNKFSNNKIKLEYENKFEHERNDKGKIVCVLSMEVSEI